MRVLVVFFAALAVASAARVIIYDEPGCNNTVEDDVTLANGRCRNDGSTDTSGQVACDEDGSWVFSYYTGSGCKEDDVIGTIVGADAETCEGDSNIGSISVDCSVEPSCFSGASFVTLPGDKKVHISEVNVGDSVLSADADGRLFFDKVFRITHWDAEVQAEVVRLTTESGAALELTDNHYVLTESLDVDSMTLAGEVEAGATVFVVSEGAVSPQTVSKVERVQATGLYNLHTLSGRVVVSGVVSTHFTSESSWGASNSVAPLWYRVVDLVSSVLGAEDAKNQA